MMTTVMVTAVTTQSTSVAFALRLQGESKPTVCPEGNLVAPDHFCAEHICRKGQIEATLVSHAGLVFSKGSVKCCKCGRKCTDNSSSAKGRQVGRTLAVSQKCQCY